MSAAPTDVPAMDSAVASDLLGALDGAPTFTFASGLFGFGDCRGFALVDAGRAGTYWLQSVEHPSLTFLLVDPFQHQPGYAVDLPDAELAHVGVASPDELLVLSIVTLAQPPHPCTMNLQAPVAFNTRTRRARQVVLTDERYGVRVPLEMK